MAITADASLVNAAYKMGMAGVPHDTSKIFQRQYKALAEIGVAQTKMVESGLMAGLSAFEKKGYADDFQNAYSQLADGFLQSQAGYLDDHYNGNNGGPDVDTRNFAKEEIIEIKDQIETLRDMPGVRTYEQSQQLKQLQKNVLTWRDENNKSLSELKTNASLLATDDVDFKESFRDENDEINPTLKWLYTQVLDNTIPINSVGITKERRNGELGFLYDPTVNRATEQQKFIDFSLTGQDFLDQTPTTPGVDKNNLVWISQTELFAGVKTKKKEVVSSIADKFIANSALGMTFKDNTKYNPATQEKIKGPEVLAHADYDSVSNKVNTDYYNIITATHSDTEEGGARQKRNIREGIIYLQNNPIQIGNNTFDYFEESKLNPAITSLTYKQLGLTPNGGFGVDKNSDGFLNENELSDADKNFIHAKLMRPTTSKEIDIAAHALADYLGYKTKEVFDVQRNASVEGGDGKNYYGLIGKKS